MKTKISLFVFIAFFSFKSYSQTTDSLSKPVLQNKDSIHRPIPQMKEAAPLPKGVIQFTPDQLLWLTGPETLPKGTMMCILYGDPKKEGPFAIRLKLPANQVIKLHVHPNDEVVTVLEGSVIVGFGDRIQLNKAKTFTAGSFYVNPAKAKHFVAIEKGGATVQINSIGPWTIEFK
jgi:mannose-6-phosphate isomerase-like protein (cupin superfamily)